MAQISYVWTSPATGGSVYVGGNEFTPGDLMAAGIGVVVSLHPGPVWLDDPDLGIRHLTAYVEDGDTLPGSREESEVVSFAAQGLAAGERLLLHCHGGKNRSCYLAARLMMNTGVDPERAVRALLHARGPDTLVNEVFAAALLGHPIPDRWRREPFGSSSRARQHGA